MSTLNVGTIKSLGSSPPVFQNSSGVEKGQLAKAWVNFDGTHGTSPYTIANGGIRDSFNVSSLVDHETGQIGVNFTTAMSNSTYVVSVVGGAMYGGNTACFDRSQTTFKAVTSSASSYVDANELDVIVFGD